MKKTYTFLAAKLLITFILCLPVNHFAVWAQSTGGTFSGDEIKIEFNRIGISSIISLRDTYQANIVRQQNVWGSAEISYRVGSGAWLNISTANTQTENTSPDRIIYSNRNDGTVLNLVRSFERNGNSIDCKIRVENRIPYPVTLGDFILPFPVASPQSFSGPPEIFERGYVMHRYIAGDASFLYYTRGSGEPPYLIVTAHPGTRFEYYEGDDIFIHSALSAGKINEGTWRLDNTSLELAPNDTEGSTIEYGYNLEWANSYDELRNIIYKNGLFDVRVIPGMTVPQNLTARFALHTKINIDSVVAEYPEETNVDFLEEKEGNQSLYEVEFNRLGENMLTIHHQGGKTTILEFFSTEPVDTLINKRSRFITESQQHRDKSKWYNGLYSVWDMENSVLRGPDNTDGFDHWWGYVLAADDPGLCKAPFVAAKNVYFPDAKEIASIEYYIRNFVWGGLQRTDKEEPYPYGIYGVPNWKVNRDGLQSRAGIRNRNLEKMPVWRAYDYPHIFMLYFHMFQIAEYFPDKVKFRDAEGYLDLAVNTARAYFTYPYEILPYYETYQWGYYNELVLLPLMDELNKRGREEDAAWLRTEWEKKVKYFVYDDPYPYRSEYAFDRTAFESSYALAKYGALTEMQPDENLWYDVNKKQWYSHPEVSRKDSRAFMERQHYAGLAVRGWLEPAYYHYGSDFSLSYMARMGGWSILDYGLAFAEKPWDWLQLGYASYLSSFALMNTGTAESNYGYWFPGNENDGATGWAFNNKKHGSIWLQGRDNPRGAWTYDGEADLGNGAIFRMAATILTKDPLFGWYAYGGTMKDSKSPFSIIPKDGVRNRFWIIDEKIRTGIELTRDGFLRNNPIVYSEKEGTISLKLENRSDDKHETVLLIRSGAQWEVFMDGKKITTRTALRLSEKVTEAILPVTLQKHQIILKKI